MKIERQFKKVIRLNMFEDDLIVAGPSNDPKYSTVFERLDNLNWVTSITASMGMVNGPKIYQNIVQWNY